MPSPVEISNIALANLGAENLVSSIDPPDGSVEAGYCATFFPIARTVALEAGKPAFALRRAALARVANPSPQWLFAYARPADCLKPVRVLQPANFASLFAEETIPPTTVVPDAGTARFQLEGDVILTDEPDATLVYVFDQVDTTKWSPMFADAVAALMSGYLAGPLIKGREGASLGTQWRQQGYALAAAATASVANAADEPAEHIPAAIRARA